jgi:hypothetical protein
MHFNGHSRWMLNKPRPPPQNCTLQNNLSDTSQKKVLTLWDTNSQWLRHILHDSFPFPCFVLIPRKIIKFSSFLPWSITSLWFWIEYDRWSLLLIPGNLWIYRILRNEIVCSYPLFLSEVKSGLTYETIILSACVCLSVLIQPLNQLTDFH